MMLTIMVTVTMGSMMMATIADEDDDDNGRGDDDDDGRGDDVRDDIAGDDGASMCLSSFPLLARTRVEKKALRRSARLQAMWPTPMPAC